MLTADSRIRSGDCPYAHHPRPSIKTRPSAWISPACIDEERAGRNCLHRQGTCTGRSGAHRISQKGSDHTPKTSVLIGQMADLDTIVTRSESGGADSRKQPDQATPSPIQRSSARRQTVPLSAVSGQGTFPRLSIVRRVQKDGALYYGPYVPTGAMRETLKVIRKVFPLATCEIEIDGRAERACLEFEIKRCMAPCIGNQTQADYHRIVQASAHVFGRSGHGASGWSAR